MHVGTPGDELNDAMVRFPSGLSHVVGSEQFHQILISGAKSHQGDGTACLERSVFAFIVVVPGHHLQISAKPSILFQLQQSHLITSPLCSSYWTVKT